MKESGDNRPSVPALRKLLKLDRRTGRLYWREARGGYVKAGQEAMKSERRNGARFGRLPGCNPVAAAVVVFALDRGYWPAGTVGHKNGDLSDNRPANLVGPGEAEARRAARKGSVLGVSGVSPVGAKYRARLKVGGRLRHLGTFSSVAEASHAVRAAKAGKEGR